VAVERLTSKAQARSRLKHRCRFPLGTCTEGPWQSLWTSSICPARHAEQINCTAPAWPKSRGEFLDSRSWLDPGSDPEPSIALEMLRPTPSLPRDCTEGRGCTAPGWELNGLPFHVSLDDQHACNCRGDIAYVTITYVPQTRKGMCVVLRQKLAEQRRWHDH